jgi:hypothetical protein
LPRATWTAAPSGPLISPRARASRRRVQAAIAVSGCAALLELIQESRSPNIWAVCASAVAEIPVGTARRSATAQLWSVFMACRFPSGASAALSLSGGDRSAKPGHRLESAICGRRRRDRFFQTGGKSPPQRRLVHRRFWPLSWQGARAMPRHFHAGAIPSSNRRADAHRVDSRECGTQRAPTRQGLARCGRRIRRALRA